MRINLRKFNRLQFVDLRRLFALEKARENVE